MLPCPEIILALGEILGHQSKWKGYNWTEGRHTQNCKILDGGWLLYMTGDRIVRTVITNCKSWWPRSFNWSKNPQIDHVMWCGVINYVRSETLEILDEVWMVSSMFVCLFVCFWAHASISFLSGCIKESPMYF